jgi:hypothetical protein
LLSENLNVTKLATLLCLLTGWRRSVRLGKAAGKRK